jgi:DNA-binding MarR family transcriptional regulator
LQGEERAARGALEDIVGFHVRLAHGAIQRQFTESNAALKLTQKQISVLWLASDHPGIAQTDLARLLDMDRATTMAIVHALEKRGFLERARSEADSRRIALKLTQAGTQALEDARAAVAEHEAGLKARFTSREIVKLIEMLRRIHG